MNLSDAMAGAGLSLISATPVEIHNSIWVCVGFEEAGRSLGDYPHLAFLQGEADWVGASDLHAAVQGAFTGASDVLTRIHSECILGDAFGSSMCDCGAQMRLAMEEMEAQQAGVFIYLRQEGRGIGLRNKLDALALQYGFAAGQRSHPRHSSDEANIAMGLSVDARTYETAAALLKALRIASVRMITGNPRKIADLEAAGIVVNSALDLWTNTVSARAAAEIEEKISRGYIYQR